MRSGSPAFQRTGQGSVEDLHCTPSEQNTLLLGLHDECHPCLQSLADFSERDLPEAVDLNVAVAAARMEILPPHLESFGGGHVQQLQQESTGLHPQLDLAVMHRHPRAERCARFPPQDDDETSLDCHLPASVCDKQCPRIEAGAQLSVHQAPRCCFELLHAALNFYVLVVPYLKRSLFDTLPEPVHVNVQPP